MIPEILGVLRKAIKSTGQPAPAADGEREELAALIEATADAHNGLWPGLVVGRFYRAAFLLRQPAPAPAPVAERPWERPGWCDAEGRCWWGRCADDFFSPEWTLATHADIEEFCSDAMPQLNLPHWAIPIPRPPQGGEVA